MAHVVAALYCPAIGIFSGVIDGYATAAFFGYMIGFVLHVHVLLHEVATFILEIFAIK